MLPDLRRAYASSVAWLETLKSTGIRDELRREARIALQEAKEDLLGMERAVAGLEKLYEDLEACRPICRHWYDSAPCTCPRSPRSLRERLVLVMPRSDGCPLLAETACG